MENTYRSMTEVIEVNSKAFTTKAILLRVLPKMFPCTSKKAMARNFQAGVSVKVPFFLL